MKSVRVNLASDILLRHSSALFCDILLLYSPDSAIFSCYILLILQYSPTCVRYAGAFSLCGILAGASCEMRESPAECVRVGNYVNFYSKHRSCENHKYLTLRILYKKTNRQQCNNKTNYLGRLPLTSVMQTVPHAKALASYSSKLHLLIELVNFYINTSLLLLVTYDIFLTSTVGFILYIK